MTQFIQPYRVGDVVIIDGGEHVISKVRVEGINDYQYATHRSAWHDHQDMTLVRECDEQSMTILLKSINDEEESDYDIEEDLDDLGSTDPDDL